MKSAKMTKPEMIRFVNKYKKLYDDILEHSWYVDREIIRKATKECRTWKQQTILLDVHIPPEFFHHFSFEQRLLYSLRHTEDVLSNFDISNSFRRYVVLFSSITSIEINCYSSKKLTPVDLKWLKKCSSILGDKKG